MISCFIALNGQFATIGSHEYSTGGDDDLSIAAEGERCEDHQHSPPRQHQHQHSPPRPWHDPGPDLCGV